MTSIEQGCIDIWIDEIVPCLKDTETGEIKETVFDAVAIVSIFPLSGLYLYNVREAVSVT